MVDQRKTLVFAVAGYNLAETGRMIEIARAAREHFDVVFASYGGNFEKLIEDEGFPLKKMEPRLSAEKLERLRVVLSGETFNTVDYFNYRELVPRVESEIQLFAELGPAAVLTGWCLSVPVSARAAGVPFVNVLHSTSIQEYYREGLQTWPDRLDYAWLRWLFGKERLDARINRRILSAAFVVNPYNKLGKLYGLKLRPNVRHIGPLPARIDAEIPREVAEMPRDRPIIYFAMGSSGRPKLIAEILEAFEGRSYRVIAPVRSLIECLSAKIPTNVCVTGFLPAHKVNPLADLSVIHGGQNTVMQACLSVTPIVGTGMHPELEANLEACVRKGFAIRLNKWRLSARDMLKAIEQLLNDAQAKQAVEAFRKKLESWDGPENAAKFLVGTFLEIG